MQNDQNIEIAIMLISQSNVKCKNISLKALRITWKLNVLALV